MDPGKYPEKEPILCHRVDQRRHSEHGTIESGRENGNMYGRGEAGQTRASALLSAWDKVSLCLLYQS